MNFINVDALLSDLTNMYKSDFKYNLRDIIHYIEKYPTVRLDTYIPKGEWNYIQAGMAVCPFCGAKMIKDFTGEAIP